MIQEEIVLNKLKIPTGYKEIIQSLKQNLQNNNYHTLVESYAASKQSLKLIDVPKMISTDRIDSKRFLLNQTTLFSQSEYFGNTAKTAPLDVKPLLYHYAANSLFAFMVYSLNSYTIPHAKNHGLKIQWDNEIGDIKVQILSSGFFSRIVDCYCLCKCTPQFSPLKYDSNTNGFVLTDYKYSLIKQPTISLNKLIKIRENLGQQQDGYLYDLVDFILLFIGSSLARYRPSFWTEIIRGEKGTHLAWFNQCFDRFDIFRYRILQSIVDIHKTGNTAGCHLHKIDIVTKQEMT